jgi:hypothetical protein
LLKIDKDMSKLVLILIAFLTYPLQLICQRKVDITTRILKPKAKDTFISPGLYFGEYSIINLGPDSLLASDGFTLEIVFGNVIYPYISGKFRNVVHSGDSVVVKNNLPTRFDATNFRTEMCAEVLKISSANKLDSVVTESSEKQKNNRACVPMVHISYLSTSQIKKELMLYPNPTEDKLQGELIQPGHIIEVYSLQGNLMLSTTLRNQEFSIRALPPTSYWIRILTPAGAMHTHWICKQ